MAKCLLYTSSCDTGRSCGCTRMRDVGAPRAWEHTRYKQTQCASSSWPSLNMMYYHAHVKSDIGGSSVTPYLFPRLSSLRQLWEEAQCRRGSLKRRTRNIVWRHAQSRIVPLVNGVRRSCFLRPLQVLRLSTRGNNM